MGPLRSSLAGLALVGCTFTRFSAPPQAYTPLLDHEGQMDVAASAGAMEQSQSTVSARLAYSPLRNFEIVGGYDGDWYTDANDPTLHHQGALGLGAYVHDPILRMEALAIVAGGYGEGFATSGLGGGGRADYALTGPYAQPSLQFAVGFEIPYFELAGGVRLMVQAGNLHYAQLPTSTGTGIGNGDTAYSAFIVDHFLTIRVPIDIVRFEVTGGWAGVFYGPSAFGGELPSRAYLTGGLAFQFDTMPVTPYGEYEDEDTTPVATDAGVRVVEAPPTSGVQVIDVSPPSSRATVPPPPAP